MRFTFFFFKFSPPSLRSREKRVSSFLVWQLSCQLGLNYNTTILNTVDTSAPAFYAAYNTKVSNRKFNGKVKQKPEPNKIHLFPHKSLG